MDKHYTMGKICGVCGKPRTNESTALCQDCNRSQAKSRGGYLHNYPTRRARMPIQAVEWECVHHYQFQTPNGPVSSGTSTKCGDVTEGFNSIPIDTFSLRRKNNFSEDPAINTEPQEGV